MATNTIYCKKPVNMQLREEYSLCSISDAKEKAKSLRAINPECIIKRRGGWVFVFEDRVLSDMVKRSNKKFWTN